MFALLFLLIEIPLWACLPITVVALGLCGLEARRAGHPGLVTQWLGTLLLWAYAQLLRSNYFIKNATVRGGNFDWRAYLTLDPVGRMALTVSPAVWVWFTVSACLLAFLTFAPVLIRRR